MNRRPSPAQRPPADLDGLDPSWSRVVLFADHEGRARSAHVLDSWAQRTGSPELTLLCVHGNPTWAYLWRRLLAQAPDRWRVVAVDQLGMGYSERLEGPRRLAERVTDLGAITAALGIDGPTITVAHDWGGPVSLGWALDHRPQLAGVVLTNTAVTQPPGSPAPALIRAVRAPGVLPLMTVRTEGFLRGALRLGPSTLTPAEVAAFRAPYASAQRRAAIGDFVADIPLDPSHPSFAPLARIADGVRDLDVPALMLWGPDDPVFGDLYLRDLLDRMPHAQVHRYEGASHLVTEHAPQSIPDLIAWVGLVARSEFPVSTTAVSTPTAAANGTARRDLLSMLRDRRDQPNTAIVELGRHPRSVSWKQLAGRVDELAAGLLARGVRAGERVALLVPPGADLTACIYACWRIGAVVVVADSGLGVRGMTRALRSAHPQHLIAVPAGLALVRAARIPVPGLRVLAGSRTGSARALGADAVLMDVAGAGAAVDLPPMPGADAEALVAFTSGATGPAKGVVYRHGALEAQRDALTELYAITSSDSLVAAFAPWAVLGPALGIASAVPDMNVTSPSTLRAGALADAVQAVSATLVWASPAALRAVLGSAATLTAHQTGALSSVRLLMSAGAPVPQTLLEEAARLFRSADVHTPYGMTEVLPVADISLKQLRQVGPGVGVCVGVPISGVEVAVCALDHEGIACGQLSRDPEVVGEIVVRSAHMKDRYDRLWATQQAASQPAGWHRTGDVGHLDSEGRLWVEGRLAHLITTADGPVTPVHVEQIVESLPWVQSAAAVGVGPDGCQQLVVIVVPQGAVPGSPLGSASLMSLDAVDAVRAVVPTACAVLRRDELPVDARHNSKIDRAALRDWATGVLAGGRSR